MEKPLKQFKDEVLAIITQEINRCHDGVGKCLAERRTVMGGVFEEVRDNLIDIRGKISKIELNAPEKTEEKKAQKTK